MKNLVTLLVCLTIGYLSAQNSKDIVHIDNNLTESSTEQLTKEEMSELLREIEMMRAAIVEKENAEIIKNYYSSDRFEKLLELKQIQSEYLIRKTAEIDLIILKIEKYLESKEVASL